LYLKRGNVFFGMVPSETSLEDHAKRGGVRRKFSTLVCSDRRSTTLIVPIDVQIARMPRPLSESSIVAPTPSDIDIAQSVEPLPITDVAEVLFEARQLELYGACKAKVKISEVLGGSNAGGENEHDGYVCLSVCLGGGGLS
jgi:hypothetical protein